MNKTFLQISETISFSLIGGLSFSLLNKIINDYDKINVKKIFDLKDIEYSFKNFLNKGFYIGFILGFCTSLIDTYNIKSLFNKNILKKN